MKKYIKLFVMCSIPMYLIGSFYSATFNINYWSVESRFIISLLFGMIMFIFSCVLYFDKMID